MVLHVKPSSKEIVCSEGGRVKSSICQPRDNIGISCIFSSANGTRDKPASTGVRRKYAIPKDNLGVACLPTEEDVRLRDIPEISERDSTAEIYSNANDDTPARGEPKLRFKTTKMTGKARCTVPKDNLSSSGRHINGSAAITQIRLRGGEDRDQLTRDEMQNQSNNTNGGKVTPFRPKGNVNFFEESEEGFILPKKTMEFRSTSFDVGISNIRRPRHDPTKPRKPIVPRDNIGFSGRHLQKTLIRPSCSKATAISNIKKISRDQSGKKESSLKSLSNWLSEKETTPQIKSLNTNRHKPK